MDSRYQKQQPGKTPRPVEETRTGKPRIRRIGDYRYLIESRSQPGVGRQVDTLRLRCSCPAGMHGRRCHHLVTALAYEDWRRREMARTAMPGRSAGMAALADAF